MFIQIALGTFLMLLSIMIAGVSFWLMEILMQYLRRWLMRPPHRPKLALMLCSAAIWVMAQMMASVWIWALALLALGVFDALEPSIYFALVAFTTLGFGDVLLPIEWRLLSGMAAANGLLNIGLATALLVEALRQIRMQQLEMMKSDR